jgi:hypothetical protein
MRLRLTFQLLLLLGHILVGSHDDGVWEEGQSRGSVG